MRGDGPEEPFDTQFQDVSVRDAGLVTRIRKNDVDAFETLVRLYADMLINVTRSIAVTDAMAQDIVQDVFFRVWDMRDRLDIRGSVAAYLIRAARNQALKAMRHERSQARIANEIAYEYAGNEPYARNTGEHRIAESENHDIVARALATLQPRLREVFLLRVDHGLKAPEIAEALGIAPATVHSLIYRATKELAAKLRELDAQF